MYELYVALEIEMHCATWKCNNNLCNRDWNVPFILYSQWHAKQTTVTRLTFFFESSSRYQWILSIQSQYTACVHFHHIRFKSKVELNTNCCSINDHEKSSVRTKTLRETPRRCCIVLGINGYISGLILFDTNSFITF